MVGGCQSYAFFPSAEMDLESLASEFCAQAYYQLTSQTWRPDHIICDASAFRHPAHSSLLPNLVYVCLYLNSL